MLSLWYVYVKLVLSLVKPIYDGSNVNDIFRRIYNFVCYENAQISYSLYSLWNKYA